MVCDGINCRVALLDDRLRLEWRYKPVREIAFGELQGIGILEFGWGGFVCLRGHVGRSGWIRFNTSSDDDFVYVHFARGQEGAFMDLRDALRARIPNLAIEARHLF